MIYKTDEFDKEFMRGLPACNVMDELPAVITAVWSDECVNLNVLLDGEGTIWKTSVQEGEEETNWRWPKREE